MTDYLPSRSSFSVIASRMNWASLPHSLPQAASNLSHRLCGRESRYFFILGERLSVFIRKPILIYELSIRLLKNSLHFASLLRLVFGLLIQRSRGLKGKNPPTSLSLHKSQLLSSRTLLRLFDCYVEVVTLIQVAIDALSQKLIHFLGGLRAAAVANREGIAVFVGLGKNQSVVAPFVQSESRDIVHWIIPFLIGCYIHSICRLYNKSIICWQKLANCNDCNVLEGMFYYG